MYDPLTYDGQAAVWEPFEDDGEPAMDDGPADPADVSLWASVPGDFECWHGWAPMAKDLAYMKNEVKEEQSESSETH